RSNTKNQLCSRLAMRASLIAALQIFASCGGDDSTPAGCRHRLATARRVPPVLAARGLGPPESDASVVGGLQVPAWGRPCSMTAACSIRRTTRGGVLLF